MIVFRSLLTAKSCS